MKRFFWLSTMMVIALVVAACGSAEPTATPVPEPTEAPMEEAMEETMSKSIVDIAVEDGRFTTLVAAVQAAGLASTLSQEGEFTVFAPTDDAFAALPEGTVDDLLMEPEGALKNILLYHVAPGAVRAETVVTLESAETLQNELVSIKVQDGKVVLNDSIQVLTTDIEASNGIIHVIDGVLIPPSLAAEGEAAIEKDIVDVAVEDGRFTTLVAAVEAAGLVDALSGEGPLTVFAPTDDAFAALPEGTVESLLEDPSGALTDILLYHVVEGAVMAESVVSLESAPTLQGEPISINVENSNVFLNETVQVIITDIEASNGVIHVIDAVLLPPSMTADTEDEMSQTIAEIAAADGRFTTLVAALDAAGLVETFAGEGAFTVFAPTDDAFAALPEGTVDSLLDDPAGDLTNILLYHVVDGVYLAEDVVELDRVGTLLGQDITIEVTDEGVILNGAVMIVLTDIQASNGVIHVIDAVLIPAE